MTGPIPQAAEVIEPQVLQSITHNEKPQTNSRVVKFYSHPWTQVILISVICFCCPGMYNALTGIGGSGQVNTTVAANANVALSSVTAVVALFFAGPLFALLGPRLTFLIGGWTYALYSGSLLNFNHDANGGFVIAAGAILGAGSSFIWVVQGAIMTTYVDESQKGRAIATFWIIFNLGGGIGSLASFGINYHSTSGTVSDSTYIALMVIMLFGWALGLFICAPRRVCLPGSLPDDDVRPSAIPAASAPGEPRLPLRTALARSARLAAQTLCTWRVACMLPLFFSANVFYSYQQNDVNGGTFNIRTRSLNGALYWFAQMFGGLVIGLLLDWPALSRPVRARVGWAFVLATGMGIWGGGLAFQYWENRRRARGGAMDLDYTQGNLAAGPMVLYVFYGMYDALWQGFAYWMIGTESNSADRAAVLVGAYKAFQAAGGAMAWRVNAVGTAPLAQLGMDWGLCAGSLLVIAPAVWTVSRTTETGAVTRGEGDSGTEEVEESVKEKDNVD